MSASGSFQGSDTIAFLQFKEKERGIERRQEGGKEGVVMWKKGEEEGSKALTHIHTYRLIFYHLCRAYTKITA